MPIVPVKRSWRRYRRPGSKRRNKKPVTKKERSSLLFYCPRQCRDAGSRPRSKIADTLLHQDVGNVLHAGGVLREDLLQGAVGNAHVFLGQRRHDSTEIGGDRQVTPFIEL